MAEIADSTPKEDVLKSFALLLFRMAATEAQLMRSTEATTACGEHAQLYHGNMIVRGDRQIAR